MLTHIDLFSGIGGFALACQWNGIETEVFCEKDEKCRGFLERTYPWVPIVSDVREFDGTKWRGRFILTAGVPCQPASRAGKQRGKDDDRWLWEPALRVVSEARPDWVLFENPLGINDVGLDGILADLEGLDYEVAPPLIIPACAVNSPQLRNRYWIVAKSNVWGSPKKYGLCNSNLPTGSSQSNLGIAKNERHSFSEQPKGQELYGKRRETSPTQRASQGDLANSIRGGRRSDAEGTGEGGRIADRRVGEEDDLADTVQKGRGSGGKPGQGNDISDTSTQSDLADTEDNRHQRSRKPRGGGAGFKDQVKGSGNTEWDAITDRKSSFRGDSPPAFWSNSVWLPCADGKVRRAPDDSFGVAHGLHRSVLAGLGNSIVPQVSAEIIKAIKIASGGG